MRTREQYLEKLESLKKEIVKMGVLVEEALGKAMQALIEQNTDLAKLVIEDDEVINKMEIEIEDRCIALIATEQPVAGDLRHVVTGMKIITQLERMGDHAVHIAKAALRIDGKPYKKPLTDIPIMGEICMSMNREVLSAFMDDDAIKASDLADMDDDVDRLHEKVQRELFTGMVENEAFLPQALQLTYISRYLERYADHITNISEWIIYGNTGYHVDLNC